MEGSNSGSDRGRGRDGRRLRLLALQHARHEGLGHIEVVLRKLSEEGWVVEWETLRLYEQYLTGEDGLVVPGSKRLDESCPSRWEGVLSNAVEEFDALIVLGGPYSVNRADEFEFLGTELKFLRRWLDATTGVHSVARKPTLGICLGAQLVAKALGAEIRANSMGLEIGWFALQPTSDPSSTLFDLLHSEKVFEWHGDTFDIPPGASWICSTTLCPHQAFSWSTATSPSMVLGLQFHPEMTPEMLQLWLGEAFNQEDLREQPPELLRQLQEQTVSSPRWTASHRLCESIVRRFLLPQLDAVSA